MVFSSIQDVVDDALKTDSVRTKVSNMASNDTLGEVSGHIFVFPDNKVDVVQYTGFSDNIKDSLDKFVKGDNDQSEFLFNVGNNVLKNQVLEGSDSRYLLLIRSLIDKFREITQKRNEGITVDSSFVNNLVGAYKKYVLSSYSALPILIDSPKNSSLSGYFHVHNCDVLSSDRASDADLLGSIKLSYPMYIFNVPSTSVEKIYKVFKGNSEVLYKKK